MSELNRLIAAFGHSCNGIKRAYKDEAAFRLEMHASIAIIPLTFYLAHNRIELALLLASWLLVPAIELLNSGLEAITDYATKTERHDLAKKTKDVGSAAVLFATVIFIIVWAAILL